MGQTQFRALLLWLEQFNVVCYLDLRGGVIRSHLASSELVFLIFVPDKGVDEGEMLHWDKEKLLIHFVRDLNSGPVAITSIPQSRLLDYWRK